MTEVRTAAQTLAARKGHPYYIYAPPYRETSSGIMVLHRLCHLLNRAGYEAFIVGTDVVDPKLDTPLISQDLAQAHQAQGRVPIAVYPEVVSGNPLNAEVCARYILNRIGFITGKPLNEGKDDLFFYYSEQFIGDAKKTEVDYLYLSVLDTELFKPDPSRRKDRSFVFQSRFPLDKIDFSLFPAGTELLSMANPVSLPELAHKLQGGRVLYSYEVSAVCTEAMMCGCPVIYMHEGGLTETPSQFAYGTNGAAMVSERNGLARATATVDAVYAATVARSSIFPSQLAVFIEKTQNAVRQAQVRRQTAPARRATPRRRIAAVTSEPVAHRWSTLRIGKPFELLADHWDLFWPIHDKGRTVAEADVLLLARRLPLVASREQIEALFALGKPVIYETNEPCHDLPPGHPLHFLGQRMASNVEFAMRKATALLVPTPALADKLRAFNANVQVLPVHVDLDRFYAPVRTHGDPVRIGIRGTAAKPQNFALIEPALNALRERFAGQVQFVFVGAVPPAEWMSRADVTTTGIAQTYDEHAEAFRQLALDIGVMPLASGEPHDDETRIEWLEYAAAGVATAGSGHPAYAELITPGCSGVSVPSETAQAWLEALARLVEDAAYRRCVARTAQSAVVRLGSLQAQIARHHEVLLRCIGAVAGDRPTQDAEPVPAVLILDPAGDAGKVQQSLARHAAGPYSKQMVVVLTTQHGDVPEWSDGLRYLRATAAEYPGALEQLTAHAEFDWTMIAEAGVTMP